MNGGFASVVDMYTCAEDLQGATGLTAHGVAHSWDSPGEASLS